jgi:hypothetical protein
MHFFVLCAVARGQNGGKGKKEKKKMNLCPSLLSVSPPSLHSVYELYCDYVLKNPFHELDQVVKGELFDAGLMAAVGAANRRWGRAGAAGPA